MGDDEIKFLITTLRDTGGWAAFASAETFVIVYFWRYITKLNERLFGVLDKHSEVLKTLERIERKE